jgi:phenylacetate-coenzyme A ligase PaaK-like adenylate-forming protein
MHLPDDLVIIEPVDLNGRPVAPGAPAAKVYFTNLYNRTQPLIRFEVADSLTLLDGACACGSEHRRIADLTGRADTAFEYEKNVVVHPKAFIRLVFAEETSVVDYQVRQTELGVSITVVADETAELHRLWTKAVRALQASGLADPDVTVESAERLERGASGKLQTFVPLPRA